MSSFDFLEGLQYSNDVYYAVRYGYQYRKEAEAPESTYSHNFILGTSEILLWLGQNVINGVTFDILKKLAIRLYDFLKKDGSPLANIDPILLEERELETFYRYVKEFNEHSMFVTEKQFQYIKDEVRADYYGKEVAKIMSQENRLPTHEEYVRIVREAEEHAETVMNPNPLVRFNSIHDTKHSLSYREQ